MQVDVGAESLLALRPEAVGLAREVGLADALEPPRPVGASLWSRDALRGLPPRTLMGVPSSAEGLEGLLTRDEVARVLAEPGQRWAPVEEDVDTLGGLAFVLAGRIPQPGEIVAHPSGWRLEVTEGDSRKVKRLRLHAPEEPAPVE